jgi:hypothetical protein
MVQRCGAVRRAVAKMGVAMRSWGAIRALYGEMVWGLFVLPSIAADAPASAAIGAPSPRGRDSLVPAVRT